ncbi:hypothetical protein CHS0354_037846 [Potamilus streckersoni]|uniref:Uncharacterized protein n=1 Tax=Potamilus streckersoni TaxID=2493646 RepID=A0AAE0SJ51_9BIVA|nr:hypothetical protein CHS0354_037846 [Potamilus streckersoni]
MSQIAHGNNVILKSLCPDSGEIKQGYVGGNILITELIEESIFSPRLYHNYQLIAVLRGSSCDVSTNSPFYGRVRCSKNKDNNKIRIEINDVIENETGLYKLETEGSTTQRWFLNITAKDFTRANMLDITTTPESSDRISLDQPSNVPLTTTVISSSPVNSGNLCESNI